MADRDGIAEPGRSDELEKTLVELGGRVWFPRTPELAAKVAGRLAAVEGEGAGLARVGPTRRLVWLRRAAAAGLTIVLAGVVAGATVPGARQAIADRIAVGGVSIWFVEATAVPGPVGEGMMLGRRVDLREAEEAFGGRLMIPEGTMLGRADEIYLSRTEGDPMVSFVYRERPSFPISPQSGAAALLSQMPGETERGMIEKGIVAMEVGEEGRLEAVEVAGAPGFWIEGQAHGFFYRDPADSVRRVEYRLAGNVLLWEREGVTFRLEADVSREAALAVAASLVPATSDGAGAGTERSGGR